MVFVEVDKFCLILLDCERMSTQTLIADMDMESAASASIPREGVVCDVLGKSVSPELG